MSRPLKESYNYRVKYTLTYFDDTPPTIGEFIHPNTHPREDQVLRQLLKLEPKLAQAKYVAILVELNPSNLGYKPYFGFDHQSIAAFIDQVQRYTYT